MTSSPGFQRVTPSPTFQTMPEASEPPMWWSSAWAVKTDTGSPRAAQTLLKFTPAAITRTTTSKAPGSGVSISSSRKASTGSPKRSSRITQAAMVGGSSPGSASNRATWLTSTATCLTAPIRVHDARCYLVDSPVNVSICRRRWAGYLALVIVDCAVYEAGSRRAGELPLSAASEACRRDGAFVWLGMVEPSEEEFDAVQREFELHELAVEDAVVAHQRPKLEVYGDTLFMVLKTLRFDREAHETDVETGEIMVFVNEAFVITVRHGQASGLHDVRLRLEKRPGLLPHRTRRGGAAR